MPRKLQSARKNSWDQMAKSPLTFSSSSTCDLSAASHICSIVIASRLPRRFRLPGVRTDRLHAQEHRVCAEIFGIGRAQRHCDPHDLAHRDAPTHGGHVDGCDDCGYLRVVYNSSALGLPSR
jgi:hypothetical protein